MLSSCLRPQVRIVITWLNKKLHKKFLTTFINYLNRYLCHPWIRIWSSNRNVPLQNHNPPPGAKTKASLYSPPSFPGADDQRHARSTEGVPCQVLREIFLGKRSPSPKIQMLSPNTTEHFLFIFANKNVIAHFYLTRLQSLSPHVNHWVTESCNGAAADGDLNFCKSWPILQRYRRLWLVARVLNFYLRQSYLLVWFLVRPRSLSPCWNVL